MKILYLGTDLSDGYLAQHCLLVVGD